MRMKMTNPQKYTRDMIKRVSNAAGYVNEVDAMDLIDNLNSNHLVIVDCKKDENDND
jgi:hypothetical protein